MKVTRVAPVFPSLKQHLQNQYEEQTYLPKKRPATSFKSLLEKELQPQIGSKLNVKC